MQSTSWNQLQLPEKVEQLHREFDELIRVERHNVGTRDAQRRNLETRLAAVEEEQRQFHNRFGDLGRMLARIEGELLKRIEALEAGGSGA